MDDSETEQYLSIRHSFCIAQSVKNLCDVGCRSDINVQKHREHHGVSNQRSFCDYYKNYEYDVLPVKDTISQVTRHTEDKESLSKSDLDKLEMNIFKNMSNEFQRDNNSGSSLESNIKFFKTTVQEIFDNFYANMRDFEIYKKRFHEILAKNQRDAVADMEDFIKDMIHHITSSDSSMSHDSKKSSNSTDSDFSSKTYAITEETSIISNINENNRDLFGKKPKEASMQNPGPNSFVKNTQPVVEAYKNFDYTTDSTMDDSKISKFKSNTLTLPKEEVVNIFLLNGAPCVQIKMTDRNLLSEINIKKPELDCKYFASADNMRKLAAKKKEIEKYTVQEQDYDDGSDKEIPVKVSHAKRNIPLNEDFILERENGKSSFISRLCGFLCKRFRKS